MADVKELIAIVKASVSCEDVARDIGAEIGKDKRCRCLFCTTTARPSMKIYRDGYYCFACHASGDTFQMVQTYLGTDTAATLRWFNDEYGLGIDLEAKPDLKYMEEIRKARQQIAAKRERVHSWQRIAEDRYVNLGKWIAQLEDWKRLYAPQKPGDEVDIRFVNAMKWLVVLQEEADRMSVFATDDYWKPRYQEIDEEERRLVNANRERMKKGGGRNGAIR